MVPRAAEEFAQGSFPGPGRAEDQDRPERLVKLGNERFWMHTFPGYDKALNSSKTNLYKIFYKGFSLVDLFGII